MKNKYIYFVVILIGFNNTLLAKSGLPQLDVSTYFPQIFWFFITFFITYIFISKVVVPKIVNIKTARYHNILSNVEQTIKVKKDIDSIDNLINSKIKQNLEALSKINKELENKIFALEKQQKLDLDEYKKSLHQKFLEDTKKYRTNIDIKSKDNIFDLSKILLKKIQLPVSDSSLLKEIEKNMSVK